MSIPLYNLKQPTYQDGLTKQSFRNETDINKILKRAQKTGTISHLAKHKAVYADFSDYDFFENTIKMAKGREIFDDLPSELRQEFHNSPADFFDYVNDPANSGRLNELLPALAEPGRQNLNMGKATADLDAAEIASNQPTTPPAAEAAETPPAAATTPPEA